MHRITYTTIFVFTLPLLLMLLILSLGAFFPLEVGAAETPVKFVPLEKISGIPYDATGNLSGFFNAVFRIGVGVAALLAVIMIVLGGFQYMTSDIPGQKSDGKDKISGAVLGLFIILLSVVILNVINPDITGFRLFNAGPDTTPADDPVTAETGIPDVDAQADTVLPPVTGPEDPDGLAPTPDSVSGAGAGIEDVDGGLGGTIIPSTGESEEPIAQ